MKPSNILIKNVRSYLTYSVWPDDANAVFLSLEPVAVVVDPSHFVVAFVNLLSIL